ncbi:MAG: TIGR00299 family protein [Denitrovibrio sp.]|nr:MAG: TIGR00299 family protein [Denitrovibrio sp.]
MHANTTLHFDINSGIAGDMALSILHGLGLDLSEVTDIIYKITGKQLTIDTEKTFVNGIEATRLKINMPHEHVHRTMKTITKMVESSDLPEPVIKDTIGIFSIIADAEGIIHGKPADEVHFHEVGALDSILDIVGFAYGVHKLGIKSITSTMPVLGCGLVKCAHGKVPVPAPATLKILQDVEVKRTNEPNELTTPTGAAILKYYVKEFSPAYSGRVLASTYSTGTLELETMPNLLRGTLIAAASKANKITVIETNIDDCSGEVIGSLFSELKDEYLDMFSVSTIGKKNRPAIHLTILCENDKLEIIAKILFKHTTTAGLRHYATDRIVMDREIVETKVNNEIVRLKKLTYGEISKHSPEWDDCVSVGNKTGESPMSIYEKAKASIKI